METLIYDKIQRLLIYYVDHIQPVYSYLVALKDKKPLQVMIEIENTFAHLAEASSENQKADKLEEKINNNLERAKNHLYRLETDIYKLLLVELKRRLDLEHKNHKNIIQLSKQARDIELNEIGSADDGHKRVIKAYKAAVIFAIKELGFPPIF